MPNTSNEDFALQQYDELLRIKPKDAELWAGKARVLKGLNRLEDELACHEQVLIISPKHEKSSDRTLEILVGSGRKNEANRFYAYLLKYDENAVDKFYNAIERRAHHCEESEKDFQQANSCYDWALEVWPNYLQALVSKITLYAKFNKKQEALDFCDIKIRQSSKEAWPWYLKGVLLNMLGEHKEALSYFDEAARITPDNNTIRGKTIALAALKDYAGAALVLEVAMRDSFSGRDLNSVQDLMWLGKLQAMAGFFGSAVETYGRALEISPSNKDAWLEKAKLHKQISDNSFFSWRQHSKALNCYWEFKSLGGEPQGDLENLIKARKTEMYRKICAGIGGTIIGGANGTLIAGIASLLYGWQPPVDIGLSVMKFGALVGAVVATPICYLIEELSDKNACGLSLAGSAVLGNGALFWGLLGAGIGFAISDSTTAINGVSATSVGGAFLGGLIGAWVGAWPGATLLSEKDGRSLYGAFAGAGALG